MCRLPSRPTVGTRAGGRISELRHPGSAPQAARRDVPRGYRQREDRCHGCWGITIRTAKVTRRPGLGILQKPRVSTENSTGELLVF